MRRDDVVPWRPHRSEVHDTLAAPQEAKSSVVVPQVRLVERELGGLLHGALFWEEVLEDVREGRGVDPNDSMTLRKRGEDDAGADGAIAACHCDSHARRRRRCFGNWLWLRAMRRARVCCCCPLVACQYCPVYLLCSKHVLVVQIPKAPTMSERQVRSSS